MGGKPKPAFILTDRDAVAAMTYEQQTAYNKRVTAELKTKADELIGEISCHLTHMRVKHEVLETQAGRPITLFPGEIFDLREKTVQIQPARYSYPPVPTGQLRLMTLRRWQASILSPTLFRVSRTPVLEPVGGFNTLKIAKELRDLRRDFLATKKLKREAEKAHTMSRKLAESLEIPEGLGTKYQIETYPCRDDPERFKLEVTYNVTLKEAQEILERLK